MELGILIASLLLKFGPSITQEIVLLIHSKTPPTIEQWQAIFDKCKSLDEYVAEAKVQAGGVGAVVP